MQVSSKNLITSTSAFAAMLVSGVCTAPSLRNDFHRGVGPWVYEASGYRRRRKLARRRGEGRK